MQCTSEVILVIDVQNNIDNYILLECLKNDSCFFQKKTIKTVLTGLSVNKKDNIATVKQQTSRKQHFVKDEIM